MRSAANGRDGLHRDPPPRDLEHDEPATGPSTPWPRPGKTWRSMMVAGVLRVFAAVRHAETRARGPPDLFLRIDLVADKDGPAG